MKAIERAPPEIRAKSKSGRLLAALKASSSGPTPNWRAMTIWRKSPSALSIPKKTAIRSDERARWERALLRLGAELADSGMRAFLAKC
jgi:hypothetical protein